MGFNIFTNDNGHWVGGGYRTGAVNIPNAKIIERALPTSRKTRLVNDNKKPSDSDSIIRGANTNGINMACQGGKTSCQKKTSATGRRRIIKSTNGWPIEAMISDSLGKFILVIIWPAKTKLLVLLMRHPEKSCQTPIFQRAKEVYGTGVSPTGKIRRFDK